jgi:hypothetical protein
VEYRTLGRTGVRVSQVDVHLDGELLDRIDEVVAPGTSLNQDDSGWRPPALADASLRRR